MKKFTVMAALLMASGMMTISAQGNLLTNAGFEGELDMDGVPVGWTLDTNRSGGTFTVLEEDAKEGSKCMELVGTSKKGVGIENTFALTDEDVEDKPAYHMSFWYKADATATIVYFTQRTYYLKRGSSEESFYDDKLLNLKASDLTPGEWGFATFDGNMSNMYASFDPNADYTKTGVYIASVGKVLFDDFFFSIEGMKGEVSGIGNISASRLNIHTDGNSLQVAGVKKGEKVSVYTAAGVALANVTSQGDVAYFENMPQGQVLIVKCGEAVRKIVL